MRKLIGLSTKIDISEYQEIKNECEANAASHRMRQTQHTRTNEERKEIEKTIKKALENLRNIIRLYEDSDVDHKRTIIATLFSNKWLFDGKKHRTGRMSEGAELIYMRNKELQNKKTGNKILKNSIPGMVPNETVDPNRLLESLTKISKLDEPVFHRHLEPQKIVLKGKKRNSKN
ncbi:hypothetical protein [Pedobacter xixiisoli]|uniref:hypothetical protein n=1 Tax=Pedobacter xixiisoli TaxID=1476464 RepID=UPI00110CBBAA|nr:hypothetical protein [Pedobacter xixiisoli]